MSVNNSKPVGNSLPYLFWMALLAAAVTLQAVCVDPHWLRSPGNHDTMGRFGDLLVLTPEGMTFKPSLPANITGLYYATHNLASGERSIKLVRHFVGDTNDFLDGLFGHFFILISWEMVYLTKRGNGARSNRPGTVSLFYGPWFLHAGSVIHDATYPVTIFVYQLTTPNSVSIAMQGNF